jgi:hypothetical protein
VRHSLDVDLSTCVGTTRNPNIWISGPSQRTRIQEPRPVLLFLKSSTSRADDQKSTSDIHNLEPVHVRRTVLALNHPLAQLELDLSVQLADRNECNRRHLACYGTLVNSFSSRLKFQSFTYPRSYVNHPSGTGCGSLMTGFALQRRVFPIEHELRKHEAGLGHRPQRASLAAL